MSYQGVRRSSSLQCSSSVQVSSSGLTVHDLQLRKSYLLGLNSDLDVLGLYGKPI